ncbi:MAG: hypothetical protein IJS08_15600, partial [Victivallales bacterium]|nr:hypothetical protein [Victivallales bacterium]
MLTSIKSLAIMSLASLAAVGGDMLWDGSKDVFTLESNLTGQSKKLVDGVLHTTAINDTNRFEYLTFSLPVTPFKFGSRSLSMEFMDCTFVMGDSLYVKCMTKDGHIVSSFKAMYSPSMTTFLGDRFVKYVMTPGKGGNNGMELCADQVNAKLDSVVTRILFQFGREASSIPMDIRLKNLMLVETPVYPEVIACEDYGVGINSSELRSSVAFTDATGHPFVLGTPLDMGRPYLLITDAITGETQQYYMPEGVKGAAFGSILTDNGKYVIGMSDILVFDVNTREYTTVGKGDGDTLCAGIAPDCTVYLGSVPHSVLIAVDTTSGTSRNLGRMDDREEYLNMIAVDKEGAVYCGIGTAKANIVAYDPVSGKRTQLLPEHLRGLGSGSVVEGEDGFVYASFGNFRIKCLGGKVVEENVSCPKKRIRKTLKYGTHLKEFGNGMKVLEYDLTKRKMTVERTDGGKNVFKIDYVSGGLDLTSMALGAEGVPYFSSAHPNHLGRFEISSGKIVDLGYNRIIDGGNFCNMVAYGDKLYGCEYAGGRLWEYSYDKPYSVVANDAAIAFGPSYGELAAKTKCRGAHFSVLTSPNVLLGSADADNNSLVMLLPVEKAGENFVNIQYMRNETYGTVTVNAGKLSRVDNVQAPDKSTSGVFDGERLSDFQMVSLGPIHVPEGSKSLVVNFSVKANKERGSQPLFALRGIEVSCSQRISVKPMENNPKILGQWEDDVTRPRAIAVHPSGKEVVMGGFAGYGLTGGGLGIHNLETGANRLIKEVLPGESCISMDFMADGNLAGGTSIYAPGGGHVLAKNPSVFVLDWESGKILRSAKTGGCNVIALAYWRGRIYAAADDRFMYIFAPSTLALVGKHDIFDGGFPLRNSFQKTPDGRLLLLTQYMLYSVDEQGPKRLLIPDKVVS